ncbi:diphenol oxidase-A2 [Dacryopinax primogenitus]|uniref:Diphenol oxidase-A2 n=1 Tax=Dacryopinax primogenitus (strain DJM 731) TaxID=1858805 RepID=M5FWT5_DACPD|nr:diphenol oxidase-A2 [Dacryopinax primogenitus]EJU02426.1 diphenol oxidase-A2 [Dacryopinax primogenitus]
MDVDAAPKPTPADSTPEAEKPAPKSEPISPNVEIKQNLVLIDRAVTTLEPRFTHRVLRTLNHLRKKLNDEVLSKAVEECYARDSPAKAALFQYLHAPATMDVDIPNGDAKPQAAGTSDPLPEGDAYIRLLILLHLSGSKDTTEKAMALAHETVERIQALNRRTMDVIAAKVYVYLARLYEVTDRLAEIRPLLLAAQRTATLRRDPDSQATLINLLLRNYLHYNLYSQADKLVSKSTFPDSAGNPQWARYQYYLGRIHAVQLSYTQAHTELLQAIRRAPAAKTAPGFWQTVHKFFIVVELLMGDIPDRALFRQPVLRKPLEPYLQIVRAVRIGDLAHFQSALQTYTAQFQHDKSYTLILRLRHNVIKTGIRSISLAYSRISLRDICTKLSLDSEEDAEYIVGKAIRDGVVEGILDHQKGVMICSRKGDVYSTAEPGEVFGRRIDFCLDLHNESVKAMRFPLNAHRKDLASSEAVREREKNIAKGIAEGEIDDDDEMDF